MRRSIRKGSSRKKTPSPRRSPLPTDTLCGTKARYYQTRDYGGRLGNQLFEYFFWRLLAMSNDKSFHNRFDPFPAPYDRLERVVPKGQELVPSLRKYCRDKIPMFPMNFKYFFRYRSLLRSFLQRDFDLQPVDLVIHVRLDDALKPLGHPEYHEGYTVVPFGFYRDAIATIKGLHGPMHNWKVVIVGRPLEALGKQILADLYDLIVELTGSSKVSIQTGSITEDMLTIMSARILLASVSSFWTWPSFLSTNNNEIHIPMFGQNNMYHYFTNLDPVLDREETLVSPSGKRIRVRINDAGGPEQYAVYGYDISITKRIEPTRMDQMYEGYVPRR